MMTMLRVMTWPLCGFDDGALRHDGVIAVSVSSSRRSRIMLARPRHRRAAASSSS
jgi:hypothetical protein